MTSPRTDEAPARPPRRGAFVAFERAEIEQSITARFERQVRRDPLRTAIVFGAERWTYGALEGAANRIARSVLACVGERPQPVVLLARQGPPLIAAILGVLRSGHCYVPLETWHAPDCVAAIVAESQAALIVADATGMPLAAAAARAVPVPVLALDERGDEADPGKRLGTEASPGALACIYYTSGTTGRPKGVADTHRNVLHNVMRYTNSLAIDRDDRLTLLQSPSFSGAVSSMFAALLNGAALLPYDVRAQGTAELGPWLVRERITAYHSVPALFREAMAGTDAFPDLRLVRIEGDAMSRRDWELFNARCTAGAVLVNGLGTTECGLVRQFFVAHGASPPEGVVPIGYPVPDMDVRVVDEAGRPVPEGRVGEIAVRSRYLAAGYWRRDDLTARAFVAEPRDPALRTYRTGDLGRLRPGGCLEHLGRCDARRKIRGQWVELAEVEAALASAPGLRECAVRVSENAAGDTELLACVVAQGSPPDPAALRRHLAGCLPAHAVPTRYRFLDRLPRNSNGKVDRAALPAPLPERVSRAPDWRTACTPLESAIATAWAEVLGADRFDIDDSFFDLGGTSLGLGRVQARLRERLGREIPMFALFDHPTIAALARHLDTSASRGAAPAD